ncbi:hypothetical protein P2H44_17340 [Albimonas sp. CAU 1670]|uniref:hypothetical protein n=1 Tax=Albimonas sp. CAU 1670 TaxID=3032599 RepID=UPI0023DCD726|nr:hypothetical protein [Albimonas sp. CAU 1670]MDF2234327.1 hypothetical protein [Albimonas sp. CAU 1670]
MMQETNDASFSNAHIEFDIGERNSSEDASRLPKIRSAAEDLALALEGLAGLRRRIRPSRGRPHALEDLAQALSRVDEALAEAVRELYEAEPENGGD